MPRATRYQPDHQPNWAATLRHEMQTMIGQLLRAQYELPQELPPEMRALLMQIDEQHGLKA
jgi:hypothetical protein